MQPSPTARYDLILRQLPHVLTLTRLLAAPVLALLLVRGQFQAALALVVFAGVTDWLDGFAARRLRVSGKLGVTLDPLADKALLVTLFVVLGVVALLPLWLVALAIGRDLVIVIGALALRTFRNVRQLLPSTLGKVSTFFQIVLVLLVLVDAAFPNEFFRSLRRIALALCALFTALSGIGYVQLGIRLTRRPASSSP